VRADEHGGMDVWLVSRPGGDPLEGGAYQVRMEPSASAGWAGSSRTTGRVYTRGAAGRLAVVVISLTPMDR
jgi:hypothetical protein